MFCKIENNRVVKVRPKAFEHCGYHFPATVFKTHTKEELRDFFSFFTLVEQKPHTDNYHTINEQGFAVDYDNCTVTVTFAKTPKSLDQLKNIKIAKIEVNKNNELEKPFNFNAHTYDADEFSQKNIVASYAAIISGDYAKQEIEWITADNKTISLPINTFKEMAMGLFSRNAAIIHNARKMKDAVLTLTTTDQIIDYPETVGEVV